MRNLIWSGLVMAVLLSGCGWSGDATRPNDITPLTSITITAKYTTIAQGTSVKLTATGNYSGYFTHDISDQVVWSSNAPTMADFVTSANPNRVSGLAPGSAVLTATLGGVSGTFNLTVSPATISFLNISTATPTLPTGNTTQFAANGKFTDGSTQDITFDSNWSSSDTTVATISNAPDDSKGLTQAIAVGTTTITATFGGISKTEILTVTAPVLQSIAISPLNPSVLSLSKAAFTATGTYSDGTTPDITSQVAWKSSNTNVAPNPIAGVTQTATQGTTTITASLGTVVSNTTTLTVNGGNLVSFPALTNMTVVNGTSLPISVIGNFGTNTSRDITGALTWTVANQSIATVTTVSGNRVLINALSPGSTTIRATSPGPAGVAQTSSAILTVVTNPGLLTNGVTLTLNTQNLTAGTSTRITASASFNNNITQDVTANLVLTPNAPAIATAGSVGPNGTLLQGGIPLIIGQTTGSTTIAAKLIFGSNTVTLLNPPQVNVVARSLQSITIGVPTGVTVGNQVRFTVTANYNNATVDVTDIATWSIDDPNIALLADPQNQPGQVIGVSSGTTTLRATFGGLSAIPVTIKLP
jgi:hypothetical protein